MFTITNWTFPFRQHLENENVFSMPWTRVMILPWLFVTIIKYLLARIHLKEDTINMKQILKIVFLQQPSLHGKRLLWHQPKVILLFQNWMSFLIRVTLFLPVLIGNTSTEERKLLSSKQFLGSLTCPRAHFSVGLYEVSHLTHLHSNWRATTLMLFFWAGEVQSDPPATNSRALIYSAACVYLCKNLCEAVVECRTLSKSKTPAQCHHYV